MNSMTAKQYPTPTWNPSSLMWMFSSTQQKRASRRRWSERRKKWLRTTSAPSTCSPSILNCSAFFGSQPFLASGLQGTRNTCSCHASSPDQKSTVRNCSPRCPLILACAAPLVWTVWTLLRTQRTNDWSRNCREKRQRRRPK